MGVRTADTTTTSFIKGDWLWAKQTAGEKDCTAAGKPFDKSKITQIFLGKVQCTGTARLPEAEGDESIKGQNKMGLPGAWAE
jgi:hypothetical protein